MENNNYFQNNSEDIEETESIIDNKKDKKEKKS